MKHFNNFGRLVSAWSKWINGLMVLCTTKTNHI